MPEIGDHVTVSRLLRRPLSRVDQFRMFLPTGKYEPVERTYSALAVIRSALSVRDQKLADRLPIQHTPIPSMVQIGDVGSGRLKLLLMSAFQELTEQKSLNNLPPMVCCAALPMDRAAVLQHAVVAHHEGPRSDRPLCRLEVRGSCRGSWLWACLPGF